MSGTRSSVGSFNLMFVDSPEIALIVDDEANKKDNGDAVVLAKFILLDVVVQFLWDDGDIAKNWKVLIAYFVLPGTELIFNLHV